MSNRLSYLPKYRIGKKIYYKPLKYPPIPPSSRDTYIVTTVGDRLDSLAHQFYRDVRLWWIIAAANPQTVRRDSFSLKPNLELRIPTNTTIITKLFDKLNK
tara:strand:- start:104 stop:406 length:303 start_codon:yes stop_codon:yes gene_type:complete